MSDITGSTFKTPAGSTITVVGCVGKNKHNQKLYKIECSICSKDKDLYPNDFTILKINLAGGSIPCGCSTSPRYTPEQTEIRLKRLCLKSNLEFVKFDSPYNGVKTKFTFKCKEHGEQSNSVYNFLYNHTRCTKCSSANRVSPINNSGESLSLTVEKKIEKPKLKGYAAVFAMMNK